MKNVFDVQIATRSVKGLLWSLLRALRSIKGLFRVEPVGYLLVELLRVESVG